MAWHQKRKFCRQWITSHGLICDESSTSWGIEKPLSIWSLVGANILKHLKANKMPSAMMIIMPYFCPCLKKVEHFFSEHCSQNCKKHHSTTLDRWGEVGGKEIKVRRVHFSPSNSRDIILLPCQLQVTCLSFPWTHIKVFFWEADCALDFDFESS